MIRARGLYGRELVDLDTAETIGYVDEIIVDPYGPCVAGYVVKTGTSFWSSRRRMIVPTEAIYAIGPDALTIRGAASVGDAMAHLNALPRLSELAGRKMVSFRGRLLGVIDDLLLDEQDGRIIGYPLEGQGFGSTLERMFGLTMGWRPERTDYVRADADLRVGTKLVVVPDEAVVLASEHEMQALPPGTETQGERRDPSERRRSADEDAAFSVEARNAPTPEEETDRLMAASYAGSTGIEDRWDEGDTTPGLRRASEHEMHEVEPEESITYGEEPARDGDLMATQPVRPRRVTGRTTRQPREQAVRQR